MHDLLEVGADLVQFAPIPGLQEAARVLLTIWESLQLVEVRIVVLLHYCAVHCALRCGAVASCACVIRMSMYANPYLFRRTGLRVCA